MAPTYFPISKVCDGGRNLLGHFGGAESYGLDRVREANLFE